MDADAALADLTEISSQVESAVVLSSEGAVLGSTAASNATAERLAEAARELLAATLVVPTGSTRELVQLEVALPEGSVFVVRDDSHTVAAGTSASPTSALVLSDLRTCLRALSDQPESKPPKRRAGAADA